MWAARDPVQRLTERLVAECVMTEADVSAMARVAASQTEAALAEALADPWPDADVLAGDLYAQG